MGHRATLFALSGLVVAVTGCRQLFGFDDAVPVDSRTNRDSASCDTTGLTCSGTASAGLCSGCMVACSEQVSQATAKSRCSAWGGTLAVLNDSQTNSCVRSNVATTGDLWIGYTQSSAATTPGASWSWPGVGPGTFTAWGTSEPDDDNGGTEIGKAQCARMPDGTDTWDDADCTATYGFACERGGGDNGN